MKPEIKDELLDELLKNYTSPEDLMGPEGLFAELKQRLISRILDSELTTHLGYEKHEQKAAKKENARNGHTPKTPSSLRRVLIVWPLRAFPTHILCLRAAI